MRIISLVPSHTEILFALGLADQLVGVTAHCDYPPQAIQKLQIGTFASPDVEKIISLQPDLVLAGGNIHKHCVEELRRSGINVFAFEPQTVHDLFNSMSQIVQQTGTSKTGYAVLSALESELEIVKEKALNRPHPKVVFVMGVHKLMTPGPASCQYNALHVAGANLMPFRDKVPYVAINWQDVIDYDPEIILSCGRSPGKAPRKRCPGCNLVDRPCNRDEESIIKNQLLANVTAIKTKHVYTIPCHYLCRIGPRMIKGMSKLIQVFHN